MQMQATNCSRRQFLTTSGLLAGSALFVGSTAGAVADEAQVEAGLATTVNYSVYDTEVLVIGTGFGGMAAAMAAHQAGANVLMVDKSHFGFSGAQGMNWDQEVTWPDKAQTEIGPFVSFKAALGNDKLVQNVIDMIGTEDDNWNSMLWWVRMGGTTWNRLEDGSFENLVAAGTGVNLVQRGFSRHHTDTIRTLPIRVIDNTMITDLLINDGKCVGAVGYSVLTGEYRVFRAKAVVASTGASCQMYGWNDVHPISMNTPDNTGEVIAAAYRHGCSMINTEFFGVDLISVEPSSLGCSFNSGIGADGNHMTYVVNADGEYFMRTHNDYDVSRAIRDTILAGKGGEHGGVWINLFDDPDCLHREKTRPCYARNVELWKEQFGIDVTQPGNLIPVCLEAFESGAGFIIDENASSQIPGLFGTRGYGDVKGHITQQTYIGAYAGKQATAYAQANALETIDWAPAEAELARIEEIRTRTLEDGIRPHVIRHRIQETFYNAWEPASTAESLTGALAELENIKADLAKQAIADKSLVYNREWRDAIENYALVDQVEATLRAALMREESRLTFYRADFPETDEKWNVNIACTLVDGEMQLAALEKVTL